MFVNGIAHPTTVERRGSRGRIYASVVTGPQWPSASGHPGSFDAYILVTSFFASLVGLINFDEHGHPQAQSQMPGFA
jgi:hypothetical protein